MGSSARHSYTDITILVNLKHRLANIEVVSEYIVSFISYQRVKAPLPNLY